jgi:hypothetical protein
MHTQKILRFAVVQYAIPQISTRMLHSSRFSWNKVNVRDDRLVHTLTWFADPWNSLLLVGGPGARNHRFVLNQCRIRLLTQMWPPKIIAGFIELTCITSLGHSNGPDVLLNC